MKKIPGKSEKNASRSEVNLVKEKKIKKKVLEGGKLLVEEKKKISSEKKKRSLDLVPVPERTSENEDGDRLKKKKISEKKLGKKEIVEEDDSDLEITLKKKKKRKKKLAEEIEDGENEQKVEKTLKKKKKFVEETEDGQNEQKVVKTLKKKKKKLVEETEDGENGQKVEKTLKKKKVVEEIENGEHEQKVEKALKKQKKKLVEDGNEQKLENKLKKKDVSSEETVVPGSSGGTGSGDGEAGKTLQGMEKWIAEYNARRPGIHVLQEQLDLFIADYEEREEQARKERQVAASGDGWTVVTRQKGKRRSADATSGIAVGAVHAAVAANAEKKTQGLDDFYKFQKRDSHRNEVAQLQLKFQEDKKKIAQMRAARKFRPY